MTPLLKPTVKLLRAADRLLSKPERWTQYKIAINKDGITVFPTDPTAFSWCARGALRRASGGVSSGVPWEASELVDKAAARISRGRFDELTAFNDYPRRTFKQIKHLFAVAIRMAE